MREDYGNSGMRPPCTKKLWTVFHSLTFRYDCIHHFWNIQWFDAVHMREFTLCFITSYLDYSIFFYYLSSNVTLLYCLCLLDSHTCMHCFKAKPEKVSFWCVVSLSDAPITSKQQARGIGFDSIIPALDSHSHWFEGVKFDEGGGACQLSDDLLWCVLLLPGRTGSIFILTMWM